MHFALVTHSLPQPNTNGGPITCWAVTKALLEAGHRVTVVALAYPWDYFNTPERRAAVLGLGADLVLVETDAPEQIQRAGGHGPYSKNRARSPLLLSKLVTGKMLGLLPSKLRRGLQLFFPPDFASVFPTVRLVPQMKAVLGEANPDAMFVYHWDSLAAVHGLNLAPQMGIVDDLWHMPGLRRWQQAKPRLDSSYLRWSVETLRAVYYVPGFMVRLLNDCEASGCFQAHSAAWLRQKGSTRCTYFRSPIMDACGPQWQRLRSTTASGGKPKILLGPSNLAGTSTGAGIRMFAREILPYLEHELGPEGFEVHVVGEGEPPLELARMLPRPSVKLRGRIEPPDYEFLSSDIQLVPTPMVLGARKRIIVGFSFGCCVVAHTNDAVNLPEIVHEENALLAADGPGLARATVRAMRDLALRERLGANARRTYERYFAPEVAATRIVGELERLAEERDGQQSSGGQKRLSD